MRRGYYNAGENLMIQSLSRSRPAILLVLIVSATITGFSQSDSNLERFFKDNIGLSQAEINSIGSGRAVAKALPSRIPAEIVLFGAVYIHALPEQYVQFAGDFERRRKLPGYLALGTLSTPPRLEEFDGFSFDGEDVQALKNCKPADCLIQMPASGIQEMQRSVNWSAANVSEQVNRLLWKTALQRIVAYQQEGNSALLTYNDKPDPVEVPRKLEYLLSYSKVLPARLPEFYSYLLTYPRGKPANVEDTFHWERVKFGLKPTLRVVQRSTMRGSDSEEIAYAIAEKQLYASHYFETALDLTFCVRQESAKDAGFFLITLVGSEQAGLTGLKGSLVRKAAVSRSTSTLQDALSSIKTALDPK
jgi:hypothetical protein